MKDRRNFLKIFGTGLSGLLLTATNGSGQTLNVNNGSLKIGILLPQSRENSQYPESFLNGLKLGLKKRDQDNLRSSDIITESIKHGSPYLAAKKIKHLISENKVNLVVGLINSECALELGEVARDAKIPTLITSAGENYLSAKNRENPYLFFNSLNLFKNSYLTGKLAVEKYGKNIAVVSSLYDSGYDALVAFYKGVEEAGGRITKTYNKEQHDNEFIQKTINNIQESEVDGIYGFINGNLANDFFRMAHIKNVNLPLLSTPFATGENQLVQFGNAANEIESICCWNKNLNNPENKYFISSYIKSHSKEPDQFGFLGYETGLIINASVENCRNDISGIHLAEAVKNCNINSPGGKISINENTGEVINPVYLCNSKIRGNHIPTNEIINEINIDGEFDKSFTEMDLHMRSGWLNPYPFI